MEFTKKYPSGLTLVAKQIDHAYTVVLGVYVDVGSVREDKSTNGFSHFIEHLMFKGTNKRTALQISEELRTSAQISTHSLLRKTLVSIPKVRIPNWKSVWTFCLICTSMHNFPRTN